MYQLQDTKSLSPGLSLLGSGSGLAYLVLWLDLCQDVQLLQQLRLLHVQQLLYRSSSS